MKPFVNSIILTFLGSTSYQQEPASFEVNIQLNRDNFPANTYGNQREQPRDPGYRDYEFPPSYHHSTEYSNYPETSIPAYQYNVGHHNYPPNNYPTNNYSSNNYPTTNYSYSNNYDPQSYNRYPSNEGRGHSSARSRGHNGNNYPRQRGRGNNFRGARGRVNKTYRDRNQTKKSDKKDLSSSDSSGSSDS